MAPVTTTLDFLAKLPLYDTEKPYYYLPGKNEGLNPEQVRLDNLEFETCSNIKIEDIRQHPGLNLDECGFEVLQHRSRFQGFNKSEDVEGYRSETEHLLKKRFAAARVVTYEVRLRKNEQFARSEFDIYDPMLVEGPAKGAHNDVTCSSGPVIAKRYLPSNEHDIYFQPGYRVRIFNTWRPLNQVLEDRPLAVCDSRTVANIDLVAADRILPDRVGEVYYLHHNPKQQWYWLDKHRHDELLIFLGYDTMSKENSARLCPHVSFDNPNMPAHAEKRYSVETRSLVITRED